ncbi:hypothetical protein [Komagataeibacter melomenusus]|nr:hypothetical protein [Komagataeibacter melomenusus]
MAMLFPACFEGVGHGTTFWGAGPAAAGQAGVNFYLDNDSDYHYQ